MTYLEGNSMTSPSDTKADILAMIEALEAKKRSIDELLSSLKETVQKMEAMPPELSELLLRPLKQNAQQEALFTFGEHGIGNPVRAFTRLRSKQFSSICTYFVQNQNQPVTVRELMNALGISRSALTNILYRTQKEAFASARVPGDRRLRVWSLKPEVFRQFVDEMGQPAESH